MTALWFAHPGWLWPGAALVGVLAAALALAFALARRRARLLLGRSDLVGLPTALRDAALGLAVLALVVAGLGPRMGERTVEVTTSGVDLVVLLDLSRSMDAADVAPSRLARARRAAQGILERMPPESRSAVAGFAGRGVLFTPLTPDHRALGEMLAAVETGLIRPGGSSLPRGIEAALEAYEEASQRPRVLFVLSDGESRSRRGELDDAVLRAARVRVLAAPQGSPLGATIPDHGTPLRDAAGEIVVSRRHDEPLARLAQATDGRLFEPDEWGEIDLDAAVAAIHRDAVSRDDGFVERAVTVPVVLPFAALAFALLLVEAVSHTRWPGRRRARRAWRRAAQWAGRDPAAPARFARARRVAALLPALWLVAAGPDPSPADPPDPPPTDRTHPPPTPPTDRKVASERSVLVLPPAETIAVLEARARTAPLDPAELVVLGVARAEAGLAADAEHAFRAAALQASDPAVAALAYHDLGVSALARGDLEAARDAFFDALAMAAAAGRRAPSTRETRFNLEWTLAALSPPEREEEPPPRKPRPDEEGERQKPRDREEPGQDGPQDREAPQPQAPPEPGEPQPAPPDPAAGAGEPPARAAAGPAPEGGGLSPDERQRWLERIRDDPGRSLRSAADPGGRSRRERAGGPAW